VKLRDLVAAVLAYPPIEKGSKGCRALQFTVATTINVNGR